MSTFIISTVGVMHDEIDDLSLEFDTLHCPFPCRDSIYPYFCLALALKYLQPEFDMQVTSQGEIRKIWKLQSKIDAKEVKISGLVDTLEKEKAAKLSLECQLAAAQKKASEKWRIPVY